MAMLKSTDKKGPTLTRRTKPTVIIPFRPTMPDVNLLPPHVFDAVQARKAQRKLAVTGAVLALVVAGAYAGQAAQIMLANKALDAETDRSVALDKQVRALTPIKVFYAGVAAQKATVQRTMVRELYFSQVATELQRNTTVGLHVETMTVSFASGGVGSSGPGSECPAANPFKPVPMVTCVQFTGTALGRGDVADFLVNLNNSSKFANVYVPVTDSGDGKSVTFNGSVGITAKFFSNRYADDGYLLKGVGAKQ
jgi:hypothetical protein